MHNGKNHNLVDDDGKKLKKPAKGKTINQNVAKPIDPEDELWFAFGWTFASNCSQN